MFRIIPETLKAVEFLEVFQQALNKEPFTTKVFHFSSSRKAGKDGWRVSKADEILSQIDIDVPPQYIQNNQIIIGDLVLTELTKEEYKKKLVEKFIKKIERSNELSPNMIPFEPDNPIWKEVDAVANVVSIPESIYDEVIAYFSGKKLSPNLRLTKEKEVVCQK